MSDSILLNIWISPKAATRLSWKEEEEKNNMRRQMENLPVSCSFFTGDKFNSLYSMFIIVKGENLDKDMNSLIGCILDSAYDENQSSYNTNPHFKFNPDKSNDEYFYSIIRRFEERIKQTALFYQLQKNLMWQAAEIQRKNQTVEKYVTSLRDSVPLMNTLKDLKDVIVKEYSEDQNSASETSYVVFYKRINSFDKRLNSIAGLKNYYESMTKARSLRSMYVIIIDGDHQKCREYCIDNGYWTNPQARIGIVFSYKKNDLESSIQRGIQQINELPWIGRILSPLPSSVNDLTKQIQ